MHEHHCLLEGVTWKSLPIFASETLRGVSYDQFAWLPNFVLDFS
jgi:hypothetical protein